MEVWGRDLPLANVLASLVNGVRIPSRGKEAVLEHYERNLLAKRIGEVSLSGNS